MAAEMAVESTVKEEMPLEKEEALAEDQREGASAPTDQEGLSVTTVKGEASENVRREGASASVLKEEASAPTDQEGLSATTVRGEVSENVRREGLSESVRRGEASASVLKEEASAPTGQEGRQDSQEAGSLHSEAAETQPGVRSTRRISITSEMRRRAVSTR